MSTRYYTRIYCNDNKIASIGVPDDYPNLVLDDFGFDVEDKYDILYNIIDRMYHTFKRYEYGEFTFNLEVVRRNTSREIVLKYQCPYIVCKTKNKYWLVSEAVHNSPDFDTTSIEDIALAGCEIVSVEYYYHKRLK